MRIKDYIKLFLKKTLLHCFWNGKKTVHKIFLEKDYLSNKLCFIKLTKKSYHILFSPLLSLGYSAAEKKLLQQEVQFFLEHTYELLSDYLKIIILHFVYDLKIENTSIIEKIFSLAENTQNAEFRYWLAQSIDFIVFSRTLTLPSNFFLRRKLLFKTICEENNIIVPSKKMIEENNKKKLCIITYLLDNTINNSLQRVLMMYVNNLRKEFDVSIICLDSFYTKNGNIANFTGWENSYKKRNSIAKMFKEGTTIFYCSSKDIKAKLQDSINFIYQINPDIILDISDEYSPTSYIYSKHFITIYSPLRRRITASYCTHYRTSEKNETLKQNIFYENVLQGINIFEWCFPEYIPPTSAKIYTRKELNLNDDAFVLVSAGALPPYDYSFYDTMIDILQSNKNYIWLLVGCEIPSYFSEKSTKLFADRRIINHGYEKNLASLYKICNVFVAPNKTGGSGVIAIAAQQGLPLVITDYPSDARRWIKEQNCLHNGYSMYKNEINKLYENNQYRTKKSKKYKNLVSVISDNEKLWQDFYMQLLYILKKSI